MAIEIFAKEIGNKLEPEMARANTEKTLANTDMPIKIDEVDYDDMLSSAGELGRYQILLFLSVFPFYMFGVFIYYSQLFITEVSPNHWCWVPELENISAIERRDLAIPGDSKSRFGYSQCNAYDVNWTEILLTGQRPDSTWKTVSCQHGWEFNQSEIPYPTISSEQGWVCEKDSYQATAQAIFFVGSAIGGFLIGWIADRYGRLPAAVVSNLVGCAGGVASTFSGNFIQFATSRFFMGMAYDNCMMMAYLLVLEYVAPKYRTLLSNLSFALYYAAFAVALPWIALACDDWRIFTLVTSLPSALAILAPFFIPESPRWLLSRGRVDEAVDKILTIGRINKKEIPPKLIEQFKISATHDNKKENKESFLEIFKRPILRKVFFFICLDYMCCTIAFDGLVRSISQLDFDIFVSFSMVSFTEFPSMIVVAFVMDWMGRRWLTVIFMTICCIFSILTMFVSGICSVMAAVTARFAVNMAYSAATQWAAELLPTSVRGTGVSIVHVCGFVSTIISPYVVYLETIVPWLPLVLIGCIAGFGGIIALGLPETAKKDMPHTIDDAENLAKNRRFWDLPWTRKKENVVAEGHVNDCFEC